MLAQDAPIIDWANSTDVPVIEPMAGSVFKFGFSGQEFETTITGGLAIGGAEISGEYSIKESTIDGQQVWLIDMTKAGLSMKADGALCRCCR